MKLQPLEKHIARSANLKETKKLVISCYLNFDNDDLDWQTVVPKQEAEILNSITSRLDKSLTQRAFRSSALTGSIVTI